MTIGEIEMTIPPFLDRRTFLFGGSAFVGGLALPAGAVGTKPRLRIGVLTDVHIHEDYKPSTDILEKELRWLDGQGVEAVVFPGDITNNGRVAELERFAAVWERVFPSCVASDGRRVERVIVSGNHDLFTDEVRLGWERVLGEKWDRIWTREVKGVLFVCAQHGKQGPGREIGAWFREHRDALGNRPAFFHVQHAHPRNTCHGEFAIEERAADEGWSTEALSGFPNAIALSGHSHIPLTDERAVWQGGFTSVGCGCSGVVVPTGLGNRRANGGMPGAKGRARLQPPALMYGSDAPYTKPDDLKIPRETAPTMQDGRAGLVIDLYDDRLVVRRRSFYFDEPVGADWTVPFPAKTGGPYDFAVRAKRFPAPQFASDACVRVERFALAPDCAGDDYRGKRPCVRVSYPCATAGGRVFEYVLTARAGKRIVLTRELFSRGFHLPEPRSYLDGWCLLAPEELPADEPVTFEVVPRNEFGVCGRGIVSAPFVTDAGKCE